MIKKHLNTDEGIDKDVSVYEQMYKIRLAWNDAKSQKGTYQSMSNAKQCADKNPGYTVFDKDGKQFIHLPLKRHLIWL